MYKLFVALRYLRRNWLNLVGMAAVCIGVLVLICVLSVMKGFDEEFRARLRATVSDLVIESDYGDSFDGYEEMMAKIEKVPHVVACAPQFEGLAIIRMDTPQVKVKRFGMFRGVDLEREFKATDLAEYWRAWRSRAARERIEEALAGDPDGLAKLTRAQLAELADGLRSREMDRFDPAQRKTLRAAAKDKGVDLKAAFRKAEAALPEWGQVADPDKESPAFPGAELVFLGRDTDNRRVSLGLEDRVVVFAPTDPGGTGMYEGRAIRRCRIKGEFRSGLYDYDRQNIYLPLADVQRFMGKAGHVTSINIRLDSFDNAPAVRAALLGLMTPAELTRGVELLKPLALPGHKEAFERVEREVETIRRNSAAWFAEGRPQVMWRTVEASQSLFGLLEDCVPKTDAAKLNSERVKELIALNRMAAERFKNKIGWKFRVNTWEDKRRTFLRAVWLERRMMGFILFFVILIAGFLVLSILHTTVVAKTKDIGILKAIGGSVGGIMTIFLLNGLFIGVIGSCLGTAAGLLITKNINKIEAFLHRLLGFALFPANVYYLDRIPVAREPFWSDVIICLTAIAVSFLASAFPAWKASRMDPVQTLRYE